MTARTHACSCSLAIIVGGLMICGFGVGRAAALSEYGDPHPAPGNKFGDVVTPLSTGNVVVTSPFDDAGGEDAGAVYLFNGATGALISALVGATAGDHVGDGGVIALAGGNYLVRSTSWSNGGAMFAGAVTWGSGTAGVRGVVSAANSLVGTRPYEQLGAAGVIALPSGNYLVVSPDWQDGAALHVGAVTWGSGASGVSGEISATNSLVGSAAGDQVGDNGVTVLSNGNYVVCSPQWGNGVQRGAGAATWGSGTSGVVGSISASNSLVGSTYGDGVGFAVTPLANGNYVVASPSCHNGTAPQVGAVTWGNGAVGVTGVASNSNSLIGGQAYDRVGDIVPLANGNYVVVSKNWKWGTITQAGAVTWMDGSRPASGVVSPDNSLVGSSVYDAQQLSVVPLPNGNYVVANSSWNRGVIADAGAVTMVDGTRGKTGVVTATNSLVGTASNDQVGFGVIVLANGNFVVSSPYWDNGSITNAGALTWCSGVFGLTGVISSLNSLVGTRAYEVGGVTPLHDGNYFAVSNWHSAEGLAVGAVTWGSGTSGLRGTISAANSLIGTKEGDEQFLRVTELANGNGLLGFAHWDNGPAVDAGAVTWFSSAGGPTGEISPSNSLVGATAGENVSFAVPLTNGNYVVVDPYWSDGSTTKLGAVTWGSGTNGVTGVISAANSLVGGSQFDDIGSGGVTALANGNYIVSSPTWGDGANGYYAGALTWMNGSRASTGVVSSANSLVGEIGGACLLPPVVDDVNGTYIGRFECDGGGRVRVGRQESDRPFIASVTDVPNDQGRQLLVTFSRSGLDARASTAPIASYEIYRRNELASPAAPTRANAGRAASIGRAQVVGWEYVKTTPATTASRYQVVVPTRVDSNATGTHRTVLLVRAIAAASDTFYDGVPDSAASVDNLAPAPPASLMGAYSGGATHLQWAPSPEPDLSFYAIYRGPAAGFIPGPGDRIATRVEPDFVDVGPAGNYYKVSVVDLNGNESPFTMLAPSGTSDVDDEGPVAFALQGAHPNPARSADLRVAFALPISAPARLELLDLNGRRVIVRDVGVLGAGRHTIDLVQGHLVPPGLYWVRLAQGANRQSKRVAVLE